MSSPGSTGPNAQRQGLTAAMPVSNGDRTGDFLSKKLSTPLSTSKFANLNNAKLNCEPSVSVGNNYPMDKLLAKLSEQQSGFQQNSVPKIQDDEDLYPGFNDHGSSSNSLPITPATDGFSTTAPTTRPASATFDGSRSDPDEVLRLKLQLAQAQNQISKLDHELTQTRTVVPDSTSTEQAQTRLSVPYGRDNPWTFSDDTQSDTSDSVSTKGFNQAPGIWSAAKNSFASGTVSLPSTEPSPANWFGGRGFAQGYNDPAALCAPDSFRAGRIAPDNDLLARQTANRRQSRYDSRFGGQPSLGARFGMGISDTPFDSNSASFPGNGSDAMASHSSLSLPLYPQYQQQPIGTPLSPHASEFTSKVSWKADSVTATENPTYLPPTEPLNYRRLLDRNVNCNWKYIVDKIVCNNDQQASIFLQQKLKVGTPEQKYEIVEAIVAQAYPLMVNRFGNFLVQRCFEHGTPEQVIKIAEAIRGNTLNLSMDPFGCHVVQKAFDSIPEEYKAIMVHELLRRIPETVIHRYACHVWQKLFELRWTESPPQIMKFVNDALRGMWHEVALGETGSLVVQNIFENCLEDDKRPCIEEVLANIDIVAHGQFGNWCIQHICEHGAPPDRSRAVDHVIRYAAEYSTDQFASKVVEKCLKIGGSDFLGRYLDRVCEGRRDRTRIPLIDIASDQYGNYLVQWILNNASAQHREVVAAHIRKHMVSLRGSKFGSRVGMLCTNHAVTTRPGHGSGPSIPNRIQGTRYGGSSGVFR